jgi:hypothetical protein
MFWGPKPLLVGTVPFAASLNKYLISSHCHQARPQGAQYSVYPLPFLFNLSFKDGDSSLQNNQPEQKDYSVIDEDIYPKRQQN